MCCSCLFQLPERISDTSNAESSSDVDDLGSPIAPEDVKYHGLAPVREEVSYCYLNSTIISITHMYPEEHKDIEDISFWFPHV
jgi:hypothetical protein